MVEPEQRIGAEDVLVHLLVVAVDVVRDLMVVAPHETGSAGHVVHEAQKLVDPLLRRHGTVVSAVLDRESEPSAAQAAQDSGQHARRSDVESEAAEGVAEDDHGGPLAARPVRALDLLALEDLLAHAVPDRVVKVGVVRVGRGRDRGDGKVLNLRQHPQALRRDLGPHVVGLEERGAVPLHGQVQQPLSSRVPVHKGRQVVGLAPVHRPLHLRPRLVLVGVARPRSDARGLALLDLRLRRLDAQHAHTLGLASTHDHDVATDPPRKALVVPPRGPREADPDPSRAAGASPSAEGPIARHSRPHRPLRPSPRRARSSALHPPAAPVL
mmetsp:Transcript_5007/g.15188  ORF Transcript_5007/g.15188 Transcript_5007/m.15188 type:complete len:326 (+) Transcript_5007:595-1572(+)